MAAAAVRAEEAAAVRAEEVAARKKALAEANAATRLAAVVRGRKARTQVDNLRRPCEAYRINMKAASFGDCMCGWPKAAHSSEAIALKACASAKFNPLASPELRKAFVQRERAPCVKYVVNLEGRVQGECMCGRPRAEHTQDALAGDVARSSLLSSPELREKFVKKELADCIQYVVNMQSSRFGECICGRLRAEHTRAALTANSSRAANIADEEKVRLSFIQREVVDCERYELDMAPGVPFGQCVCGQPKAKHSEVRASVRGLTHVIPATGSTFRSLS